MTVPAGGRIVVVGASLAGLRAAEALRREGHDGPLTLVGAEPHLPYDRPPLSKQLLAGSGRQTVYRDRHIIVIRQRSAGRSAP